MRNVRGGWVMTFSPFVKAIHAARSIGDARPFCCCGEIIRKGSCFNGFWFLVFGFGAVFSR